MSTSNSAADADSKSSIRENEMPFLSHLIELRTRLMRVLITVLIIFLCLFPFANDLFWLLSGPLRDVLPGDTSMVSIKPVGPFFIPLKLALVLSFFLAMPAILYQVWGFIAPGLYENERQLVMPLMVSSTVLFFLGMLFAYYVVFPLVFGFLVSVLPQEVEMATDIGEYLTFVLKMFFAFGLAFEVPILTILLVRTGVATPESLKQKRAYIIVGAFVLSMLLTPPDAFSQVMLAVPMWLLFEFGLIMSQFMARKKAEREEDAEIDGEDEFRPMTEEEMDAELEAIEAEEEAEEKAEEKKR
ncbi:MAG: twin-arginine translocase subunit TatC [Gammaproteobacteria bacterium]|nr:twin-arginine translocase subunit TatC [Gammaproteobacteria bacterium]